MSSDYTFTPYCVVLSPHPANTQMNSPAMPTPIDPDPVPLTALKGFLTSLDGSTFDEWYREYKHRENIRGGTPYFNHNDYVPDADRHSPSQLLQCHRKQIYRQINAPRETENADGIFYIGDVLEELIEEFLVDLASEHGLFVQNGMYINLEETSSEPAIRFKGETDPVICGHDGLPVFPTEVKSKSEDAMEYLDGASTRHRAQAHAYVKGLNGRLDELAGDRRLNEFAVIYIARESLEVRVFVEEFDPEFWESVVEWARNHTKYRERSDEFTTGEGEVVRADGTGTDSVSAEGDGAWLPPADPLEDWECGYCAYKKRCGKDDSVPIGDLGGAGFLPLTEYSRASVEAHMEAYPEVALTPTLAYQHPSLLSGGHEVSPWQCRECGDVPLDRVGWDGDVDDPPRCPECESCSLRGPLPERIEVSSDV